MSQKQQRRVDILTRLDAGCLDVATVSQVLAVSPRHVRRLLARFRQEGMQAVVHGNTGRSPANRTQPEVVAMVRQLAGPGGRYHDLNVCHLHDFLPGEAVALGRSTLDRLLREAGLRQPSRPPAKVYRRRERRSAEGMLLQLDASPFAWLEERGPKASLVGAIDDARSLVVGLLFRPTEDQAGYMSLLRQIATLYGLPLAVYHDRHTILCSPKAPTLEDELAGRVPQSQIQRLLSELGIQSIPAHSPQAKGRVERLWGTLQDRLTKEMRLGGITSLEAANAFLPGFIQRFNARFAKPALDPNPAWVGLPEGFDLAYHFAAREERTVRPDHCLQWQGQLLQLVLGTGKSSLAKRKVNVHTVPEGVVYVYDGKQRLDYKRVEGLPSAIVMTTPPARSTKAPDPRAKAKQRAWLFAGT